MPFSRRQIITGTFASLAALTTLRANEKERIPAFHSHPPKGPLPATKDPKQYSNRPEVQRVYELAGKIRPVLYQLPCYCSCDTFAGHGSLLDCFVDSHGEECAICQHEAVYAYQRTKAGIPARKIRAEIIAGEWRKTGIFRSALSPL